MTNLFKRIGEEILALAIIWVPILGVVVVNTIFKLLGL